LIEVIDRAVSNAGIQFTKAPIDLLELRVNLGEFHMDAFVDCLELSCDAPVANTIVRCKIIELLIDSVLEGSKFCVK
jgi:hypothetical protein